MKTLFVALAALGAPATALAFCGTYVGGAGAELYNHASQIAIARQGERTTLTMLNDFDGDVADFAMVVPVPTVLAEADVRTVDPAVFARLDGYSAPRLVSYTCDELHGGYWYDGNGLRCSGFGCADYAVTLDNAPPMADGGQGEDADDSVTVEAEFAAGEYQIVVLSAEDSAGLMTWLTSNGYAVPERTGALLQEYIDAGSFFFAAKVSLDALPDGQSYLSPLQVSYDAEVLSLPIRLGTANSPGEQDLIVYVVNEYDRGRAGISNYDEVTVEDECLFRDDGDGFGDFYAARLDAAFAQGTGAAWIREYTWGAAGCDPCTGTPPDDADLAALGWVDARTWYEMYFSRLHLRYRPDRVPQDVVLYLSGEDNQEQVRYIQHAAFLEADFPICGEGWSDDPGSCYGPLAQASSVPAPDPSQKGAQGLAAAGLIGLIALLRRRKRA